MKFSELTAAEFGATRYRVVAVDGVAYAPDGAAALSMARLITESTRSTVIIEWRLNASTGWQFLRAV